MFKSSLSAQFQKLFDLKKVSFDEPGESQEQECLFIDIQKTKSTIKDGSQIYHVIGKGRMFGNSDKLPYGFFAKRIKAHPDETKDVFFYDMEENTGQFQNIVERTFSFVYFFSGQYDPAMGTITELLTSEV